MIDLCMLLLRIALYYCCLFTILRFIDLLLADILKHMIDDLQYPSLKDLIRKKYAQLILLSVGMLILLITIMSMVDTKLRQFTDWLTKILVG